METLREVDEPSFETVPDMETGTVALDIGARATLVEPTIVVEFEIIDTVTLAAAGSRLALVTVM